MIITYTGIEKDAKQQNTTFEIKNIVKNRLDRTFIFVDFRGCSNEMPNEVPNVSREATPPNIATKRLSSAKRHQLYSPNANNATIANAIKLVTALNFIVSSI